MVSLQSICVLVTVVGTCIQFCAGRLTCSGSFKAISASSFVAALQPGWNPGNTLDAIPDETSWGNPPLINSTFTNVKKQGFKGIRLPVTWADHMSDNVPYTVDTKWMNRVAEVIDIITSNGFYVLVNVHHDSWRSFDLGAPNANYTKYEEKFYNLWYQIGEKLACKSSMVAFEPLNEPAGSTAEHAAELNKLQRVFFRAINDAGGFNSNRVVVLGGLGDNAVNMVQWLELPKNITNPIALTFHYYSPWDFVAQAWGKTIWGSDAEKAAVEADFAAIRGNYTDIPIIVGEFGMEIKPSEAAARWKWFDHVVRTGKKFDFAMMLWDASIHFVVDSPEPWQDPTALDIFLQAAHGTKNALADSTENGSATEQWSSAYVYHRVGEPITDKSLPFIFNGNTLVSILSSPVSGSQKRLSKQEYTVSGNNITFKANFISTLFPKNSVPGLKANITLHFSAGADLVLQAVLWDTPQPSTTDFIVNAMNAKNDLHIPFEYKGLSKLATVKAKIYNSTYLFDDWTQWLGPLQQARLVYQSHWDFDSKGVIVKSSVLQKVLEANFATGLTFEFFPRVHANTVNFTIGPQI
ncbi:glycoside hydrolase superfamily [Dendryphion nanum]|uniref:Glycoside hydrolase superfamily n=1 Tax=Dendryphion nanum TaxID=256645 RepID=A0A9P9ICR3_9PLEO|nr:glycoside hydrolase superfamily [Dendryphion nanum]